MKRSRPDSQTFSATASDTCVTSCRITRARAVIRTGLTLTAVVLTMITCSGIEAAEAGATAEKPSRATASDTAAAAPTRAAVGEVILRTDFTAADALAQWQGREKAGISLDKKGDRQMVRIEQPAAGGQQSISIRRALPVERLRGVRVAVEARCSAEGVSDPPRPWNGIKCMIHTVGPSGPKWQQQNNVSGTFENRRLNFFALIPEDATEAYLVLGLEAVGGKVWFDDITAKVVGAKRKRPAVPPSGPVYKGHDLPRLRGAMIGTKVDEADLEVLGGKWGANHVRWQLLWGGFPHSPADKADTNEYDAWLESELQRLDRLLPVCRRLGIRVVIDLHTPPGGRAPDKHCRIFSNRQMQDHFVVVWERIARRYKDQEMVWGYDLVNEPVESPEANDLLDWRSLALKTARRVREIDPNHAIIVEPAPWGSVEALDWFEPLDVPKVVYSVHFYTPGEFTHQGVYNSPVGIEYPGEIHGVRWDKERLRKALQPAVEFQRDYNVHIYLGEFSAIRWAPNDSAERYLRDCIDLFEEYGWDWAYHAFREWDGWSVEHGPDRNDRRPTAEPTARQLLLQKWYKQNQR